MPKINRKYVEDVTSVSIKTDYEKITYEKDIIKNVFRAKPDSRGRLHIGTTNEVIIIELKRG